MGIPHQPVFSMHRNSAFRGCSPFNDYFYTRADLKPYRLQGCSQFNDYPGKISGYVPTKPLIGKIKEGFPD